MSDTMKSLDDVNRLINKFLMKLPDDRCTPGCSDEFVEVLGTIKDLNDMRTILREDLAKELSEAEKPC